MVWVPMPCTGPATTSPYGWPSASRKPSTSRSSPVSRRPLPLPVQVPVVSPVQQAAGLPAPTHWALEVSSDAWVRMVIWPAVAPPVPRLTRTFQMPVTSCESPGMPSPFGSAERCTASTGFRLSLTSALPNGRARLH